MTMHTMTMMPATWVWLAFVVGMIILHIIGAEAACATSSGDPVFPDCDDSGEESASLNLLQTKMMVSHSHAPPALQQEIAKVLAGESDETTGQIGVKCKEHEDEIGNYWMVVILKTKDLDSNSQCAEISDPLVTLLSDAKPQDPGHCWEKASSFCAWFRSTSAKATWMGFWLRDACQSTPNVKWISKEAMLKQLEENGVEQCGESWTPPPTVGKLECAVGDKVQAQWCQYDSNDPKKGKPNPATIVEIDGPMIKVDWEDGDENCRDMMAYMAGKPAKGERKTSCAKIPDTCIPKNGAAVKEKVGLNGRCMTDAQCEEGLTCCPRLKGCKGAEPLDFGKIEKEDPVWDSLVYGQKKNCKEKSCDICPAISKPFGLCNQMDLGDGVQFFDHATTHMGAMDIEAYDPTHPLCKCNPHWVELWKKGEWVKNIDDVPTCPTDGEGGEDEGEEDEE
eukprot:gnl/TRDRNA2_/TRDRNA2_183652_c0_seq1.p1 gnl/TRDRNA2_/TRDRNA2_183652_c0~~gnl/TRDRNA2_/TRDRNA2_183652_c0_seq1.p1  ORF type:complete len:450 (+),score=95.40 gnl/TRDRNA2_/TRDRNA2_183652_c0_seq1:114-1463(+)